MDFVSRGGTTCQRGFTLVELMQATATLAIGLHFAVSSFTDLINASRMTTYTNALLTGLMTARSEAIKRSTHVTLLPNGAGWETGWTLFVDVNHNARIDEGEAVLHTQEPLANGYRMRGNRPVAKYVSYNSAGRSEMTSGAFQAGTIVLCDREGKVEKGHARSIVISATGRPRVTTEPGSKKDCT